MLRVRLFLKLISLIIFLSISWSGLSQEKEEITKTYHFNGDISATNNGFSFIPTFTLGKPAMTINLNVGGDRVTFEPQFRFDLDGLRPWSIVGFWRYKLINQKKFNLKLGTQLPALAYRYESAISGTTTYNKILVQRFLAAELLTGFQLSDKISFSTYYLHSVGLEKADQLESADFFTLGPTFDDLHLGEQLRFSWAPQVYYLRIDNDDGLYVTQTLSLSHYRFPVSLASTMNKAISSSINAKDFDWNISLAYSFGGEFNKN